MFKFKKNETEESSDLEELIAEHIEAMKSGITVGSEEYTAAANQLKTLMDAYQIDENVSPGWRPDANQVVAAGASLLGILAILSFERVNVITSKALTFVAKPKI